MATSVKPLLVIVGETASGKSSLAMEIAKKYHGEIISADSRAVYKFMNIGSAKPTKADQKEVRHHLIDVVEPNQRFSAAQFKDLALKAIEEISSRGNLPILVGGTGLYINSIIFDYKFSPKPKKSLRNALVASTTEELQQQVINRGGFGVDLKNKRHMIRFLETGGTSRDDTALRPNTTVIGIRRSKSDLRDRIQQRVEQMFRAGLRKEIDDLVIKYGWDNEAMTGIIYKLFKDYDGKKISMSEVKRKFVLKDIQLAKRQRTWFKRNPHIKWFDEPEEALEYINTLYDDKSATY